MPDLHAWRQDIAAMPTEDFWFWAVITTVITTVAFLFALRNWQKSRFMADTPTSTIRAAAQGYTELKGVAQPLVDEPVVGHLTQKPCVWWSYCIEKRVRTNKSWRWQTVESGTSPWPFRLDDQTDQCFIDAAGAKIVSTVQDCWRGSGRGAPPGINVFMGSYRYTERRIVAGQTLYAIGDYVAVRPPTRQDFEAELADQLRAVKNNPRIMDSLRDDTNTIAQTQWDALVERKRQQLDVDWQAAQSQPTRNYLQQPQDNRPFVISAIPEQQLIRRYRGKMTSLIAVFLIVGSISTFLWTARFFT